MTNIHCNGCGRWVCGLADSARVDTKGSAICRGCSSTNTYGLFGWTFVTSGPDAPLFARTAWDGDRAARARRLSMGAAA